MKLLLIEFVLSVLAIVVAIAAPRLGSGMFGRIERGLSTIARNRRRAVLWIGVAALLAGGLPRLFDGLPRPQQYDEFSYLLGADTFAHGRVTNPTHPLWQHFESFHILQRPSYMSMYPPAQALTLALGKVLFGHPWFGVWISAALMCALVCWTLQAWLPPSWAFLGGAIAVVRIATFSYWIESYWGGAVAAIGGALVLGAMPRLMRRKSVGQALLMAVGATILLNSRPFEGSALLLAAGVTLSVWGFRERPKVLVFVPAVALLVLAIGAMLYYDQRVTGNPMRLPYAENRAQYAVAQVFIWQDALPVPGYRHKAMHDFYLGWELTGFNLSKGWKNYDAIQYEKLFKAWMFFVGPALMLSLFPIWWVIKDKRTRTLALIGGASSVILSMAVYANPHYWAPYTALILAVMMQGLRHVRQWRIRGREVGVGLVRMIPVVCVLMIGIRAAAGPLNIPLVLGIPTWGSQFTPDYHREDLIAKLKARGGKHLVIVRYSPDHTPHQDWVYNEADIDAAPVVWAREMDAASNAELIRYFRDRQVWLLQPDIDLMKVSGYEPMAAR